ncbi:MAG: metal-dependent hydrolase [Balneolaceae bacterium]|nr:MAG: metal-dependent hydrolase [Balneolaceae bacterium]
MDPLTHALLGSAASQSFAKPDRIKLRAAAVTGFLAALSPDLDVLIQSATDPLLAIEYHRQFTHSLIFIPFGALLVSLLLWWFMKRYLTFRELYLSSLAGIATHGLLDAFTSYGTQLLWPFTDLRVAWNMVSIIDPVITLGLLLFASLSFFRSRRNWSRAGLLFFALMMAFGWFQQQRAERTASKLADMRNHTPERLVARPAFGNQIVWRVHYIHENRIYVDAVRAGFAGGIHVYEGESEDLVIPERDFAAFRGTTLYNDLLRFSHFSDGWLAWHPEIPGVLGDARYAMVPNSMSPIWGVEVDTTQTGRHLPFDYYRFNDEEIRKEFFDQLFGR